MSLNAGAVPCEGVPCHADLDFAAPPEACACPCRGADDRRLLEGRPDRRNRLRRRRRPRRRARHDPGFRRQRRRPGVLRDATRPTSPRPRVATLDKQAQWLSRYPRYTFLIEGHADERGTREYNFSLGARRAQTVRDYLASRGIAGSRIRTVSYGKERPVAVCNDISCWSQNRRAVTVLDGGAGS